MREKFESLILLEVLKENGDDKNFPMASTGVYMLLIKDIQWQFLHLASTKSPKDTFLRPEQDQETNILPTG